MTATAHIPYRTEQKDGIVAIYDHPPRTVYVDGFDWRVFRRILAVGMLTGLIIVAIGFAYPGAFLVGLLALAGSVPSANAFARVRIYGASWQEEANKHLTDYGVECLSLLALLFFALKLQDVPYVGGLAAFACCALAVVVTLAGLFRTSAFETRYGGKEIPALPRIILPLTVLEARGERHADALTQLASLPLFAAHTPALQDAWERRDTPTVEALLNSGASHTRSSWERAIGMFNAVKDDVDLARGRLRALVKDAEDALAGFEIDYGSLSVNRSGILAGTMQPADIQTKSFTQRLDYLPGLSGQVGRAVTQGSWQTAVAGVVTMVVMHQIHKSKLLRQLKNYEGQLVVQAGAVQGDLGLMGDLLRQRMLPQFDALLRLIHDLESRLTALAATPGNDGATNAAKAAFELACVMREAQWVLEMKAGD